VRENRTHGSEGGEDGILPDPYQSENLLNEKSQVGLRLAFVMLAQLQPNLPDFHCGRWDLAWVATQLSRR
jgi:hypothetical protein